MAIKNVTKRVKEYQKSRKSELKKQLKTSNKVYDSQINTLTNDYNENVKDVENEYTPLYEENEIQKIINEREINENMANLGLTDSGLNRTQQTAVQLSHSNAKAKLDLNKRRTLDTLASKLADNLSQIKISKSTAAQGIRDNWNKENYSYAVEDYNTDVAAETARQKAYYSYKGKQATANAKIAAANAKKNNYIISANDSLLRSDHSGSLKDNDVSVRFEYDELGNKVKTVYVDNKSGKKLILDSKVNPYTGTINPDIYNFNGEGVFKNGSGYQPNNISGVKLDDTGEKGTLYDIEQKIFSIGTGNRKKYYIWNGRSNKYIEVSKENGEWVTEI